MLTDSTQLNNSVARYLKYAKGIEDDKIKVNGFPVRTDSEGIKNIFNNRLNNLAILILNTKSKFKEKPIDINIFSLQNPYLDPKSSDEKNTPRKNWNETIEKILLRNGNENKNIGLFIFLFDSDGNDNLEVSKRFFETQDSTDEQFCHSMLLRDFLKKNKMGFEFDLSIKKDDYFYEKLSLLEVSSDIKFYNNIISPILSDVNNYFSLKNSKRLKEKIYCKYITDFYAYNLNCKALKDVNTKDTIIDNIKLEEVDSGHDLYGSVINEMKEGEEKSKKDIAKLSKWLIYVNIISSFTKVLIHYKPIVDGNKLNFLLIDDHPDKIEKEINIIEEWVGKDSIENKNNKKLPVDKFDTLFDAIENKKLTKDKNIDDILEKIINVNVDNNNKKEEKYDFIIIDLDYNGEQKGFEYLRKLRTAKSVYDPPYVIVFSRSEDSASVQKALNMGALFVVSKQNFANLLLETYKIFPVIVKHKEIKNKSDYNDISLGENWTLIYQLPLSKILELKVTTINGNSYIPYDENSKTKCGFNSDDIKSDPEYLWIKKLPKAELHCHIGSVLGPELIPKTALIVLSKWYNKLDGEKDKILNAIIEFLIPIVNDPNLNEQNKPSLNFNKCLVDTDKYSEWFKLKRLFALDEATQFCNQSIFTIISDSLNLQGLVKTPEEVLLSPTDDTIEKHFKPFSRIKNSNYYRLKLKLRKEGISYDVIMLFFILLLELRQKYTANIEDELNQIWKDINEIFNGNGSNGEIPKFPETEIENFIQGLVSALTKIKGLFNFPQKQENLLQFLISAHSEQRCLKHENRGLFNYLRGCEYGGAPHLQCEESIFLAAHHIIYKYAIPENIHYLDLRCAVDGYNKLNLFDKNTHDGKDVYDKILGILKNSFNYWQKKALEEGNKVHINLIITAKRHKDLKEFEKNVQITVNNFKLENNDVNKNNSFFETETKVVSFDIAGLEKNNRVSKFKEQLKPLLDNCIPITMHAGEEDSHEAIWEASYLAHAQRLGHALTLVENKNLINTVRESFLNIELCPISNYLTNNKYSFNGTKKVQGKIYPLKEYLKERISISINTDNPYVSDSTLSKEFLFAARLTGGLTKWDVLKLILYSFKAITIHKSLRSNLMKEINEEIFELLLNES